MKVARARYHGRTRGYNRRGPSGTVYTFPKRNVDDPWIEVEDVEDARRLEETRNVEVDWTARGLLLERGREVLERGYQAKRQLAADLGLDFDGQPDEETVDESLDEYIEDLQERGEI